MSIAASVTNLRLKFPGDKSLLFRDLSLSISAGEKVLLLGPSGCGKSTLLQVLTGIIPHSIEVPLKAEQLSVPESWGYVFQDPDTQFCMPYVDEEMAFVLENMQVPREQMTAIIEHTLDRVGLVLPDSHFPIQNLSQGMKQRLAIATVLAMEPHVLFLDEPTALLDPEGTNQVWETIKAIGREKTVVIVEHKIDRIVDFIDRVILFNDQGEIIADGEKSRIFTSYKDELIQYGIWYPGVWEDYVASPRYTGHAAEWRLAEAGAASRLSPTESVTNSQVPIAVPLLAMNDFVGYRGKEKKIAVADERVHAGEWITIVGDNGAGKSTLLLALMQLIKTSGSYFVNGIRAAAMKSLASQLAFVFQNPELQFVTNSVYDEIAYTLRLEKVTEDEIKRRVEELMVFFELGEQRDNHPYQLSMGQKRRLSVAAAIVKEQRILLLDEPTFGQDAKNTFAILEKIEQWRRQGTSILMVTHDPEIVRYYATRVWTVERGKLVGDECGEGR